MTVRDAAAADLVRVSQIKVANWRGVIGFALTYVDAEPDQWLESLHGSALAPATPGR